MAIYIKKMLESHDDIKFDDVEFMMMWNDNVIYNNMELIMTMQNFLLDKGEGILFSNSLLKNHITVNKNENFSLI